MASQQQQQQQQHRRQLGGSYRDRLSYICKETKSYFGEIVEKLPQIKDYVRDTTFYTHSIPLPPISDGDKFVTRYRVIPGDTIDTALQLIENEKCKPLVLNMASAFRPGGGWENGAMAQEECLFYRSTYDLSLSDPLNFDPERNWHYPIPFTGAIYSPNVYVFRGNPKLGFPVWDYKDCVFLDFIAVPAIRNPYVSEQNRLSYQDVSLTKKKIRTCLRVAHQNGHDTLLLGALGCGAYHNPPEHIAELFCQVLTEEEFHGRFKDVIFAILDGKNEQNYIIFKQAIEKLNDGKKLESYKGDTRRHTTTRQKQSDRQTYRQAHHSDRMEQQGYERTQEGTTQEATQGTTHSDNNEEISAVRIERRCSI